MRKTARIEVRNRDRNELGDFSRWIVVRAIENAEGSPERQLWTDMYNRLVRPLDKAEGDVAVAVTYRPEEITEMLSKLDDVLGQMDPDYSETFELVTNLRQLLIEVQDSGQ
jgi:hypothetical protein